MRSGGGEKGRRTEKRKPGEERKERSSGEEA